MKRPSQSGQTPDVTATGRPLAPQIGYPDFRSLAALESSSSGCHALPTLGVPAPATLITCPLGRNYPEDRDLTCK